MKWLVDHQLPPALARFLAAGGEDAVHARDCGLNAATDLEVVRWAILQDRIVVTKDEDFLDLAVVHTELKVLWVRLGNCRRSVLLESFERFLPEVRIRFASEVRVVELR